MNVDFFVFGVPDGFDLWEYDPKEEEHFGTFYDNSPDKVKFLVQMHPFNGRSLCYYNYLVYADVVDQGWRPNSFFGISLRFDTYCKDALKIYRLLDYVFNAYIIGGILQKENGKIRYIMSQFYGKEGVLNKIKDLVFEFLQTGFSQEDFTSLGDFPEAVNTGKIPLCNLYECSPEAIFTNVRQFGRIAISPYYPSSIEQETLQNYEFRIQETEQRYQRQIQEVHEECNKKLIDAQNSHNLELAEKEREKESAMASVNGIRAELSSKEVETKKLTKTIESLNWEVERLKSENEKIKRKETQTANSKSDRTNEASTETYRPGSFVGKIVKWLNSILRIFGFIILLILLFRPNKQPAPDYSNLESKLDDIYTVVRGLQSSVSFAQNDFYGEPEIDLSAVVIDIKEYKGGGRPLDKGKKYTVEAKNSSEKNAVWEVTGGTKEATNDPNKIYVTPKDDNVEIIYHVGNSTKKRELKAQ